MKERRLEVVEGILQIPQITEPVGQCIGPVLQKLQYTFLNHPERSHKFV